MDDHPDSVFLNSMEYWEPLCLKLLFDSDLNSTCNQEFLNSLVNDLELVSTAESVEKSLEYYNLIVEDITMADGELLAAVNKIEEE